MQHLSGTGQPSQIVFFTAPPGDPSWFEVRAVPAMVSHSGSPSPSYFPVGLVSISRNGALIVDLAGGFDVDLGPLYSAEFPGIKQVLLQPGDTLEYSIARTSGVTALSWTLDLYLVRVGDEL